MLVPDRLNLFEHFEDVEGDVFLVLKLFVYADFLKSDFTPPHRGLTLQQVCLVNRRGRPLHLLVKNCWLCLCLRLVEAFFELFSYALDAPSEGHQTSLRHKLHFSKHAVEAFKQLQYLFLRDDKEMGFHDSFRLGAPHVLPLIEDHLNVAKVVPFDAQVHGYVLRVAIRLLAEDVVVELDATLDDKEDFFSRIVLSVQCVVLVDLHLTEEW